MLNETGPAPLRGVRVLDLSRVLAGPWATQLLADLGAEVIKVERPGRGDDTRGWGPPWLRPEGGEGEGESAYFLCANRGKRSLTLDLAHSTGQSVLKRLIRSSDVLVENFRAGSLARFGLDRSSLEALNPRLVHCAISGFGRSGPGADRAGYDAMVQAAGGLMSITGPADGEPQKVGVAVADLMCGLYASSGILAALMQARESGQGSYIDLSLFDCQLSGLANQAMNFLLTGQSPGRMGSAHPNIVPYQCFECADGAVMLAIGNDRQFARWCDLAGYPEWAEDERFATNRARVENREALLARMRPVMAQRDRAGWQGACESAGIPCGPINSIGEALSEPAAVARGMGFTVDHPYDPKLPQVGSPLVWPDGPARSRRPPPLLGQHNREILAELGYSASEIDRFEASGVI